MQSVGVVRQVVIGSMQIEPDAAPLGTTMTRQHELDAKTWTLKLGANVEGRESG